MNLPRFIQVLARSPLSLISAPANFSDPRLWPLAASVRGRCSPLLLSTLLLRRPATVPLGLPGPNPLRNSAAQASGEVLHWAALALALRFSIALARWTAPALGDLRLCALGHSGHRRSLPVQRSPTLAIGQPGASLF